MPPISKNRRLTVIVIASIAIILAAFYYLTPVGAIEVYTHADSVPWSTERATALSDKIVVAKILSVNNIVVNEPFTYIDQGTGEQKSYPRTTPYHTITLDVERYLKDDLGDGATQLTYRICTLKESFSSMA